jgi:hypothetical protein
MALLSHVMRFRRHHNRMLPRWYHWLGHVLINAFLLITTLFIALPHLRSEDRWLVAAWLPVWSILEYVIHRFALHRLHLKVSAHHNVFHHGYFTARDMHATKKIDTNRILLLPLDLFSLLVGTALLAWLGNFLTPQLGASFFIAAVIYIFLYEAFHAVSHLPMKTTVFKHWTAHHQTHHDSLRMHEKNFSVVVPWLDRLFGSHQ